MIRITPTTMRLAFFRGLSWLLATVPVDRARREALKAFVYRRFGPLFRGSPNYAEWLREHPTRRVRAVRPPAVEPSEAEWGALAARPATRLAREADRPGPYVVVPIYRGRAETLRCLYRVRASAPDVRLVAIDDGTPDRRLRARLRALAAAGHFELLRNDRNRGFLVTANRGLALDPDRDVVLLNSDTQVFGDWLDRLEAAAHSAPDIGTVTPFADNGDIVGYPRPRRLNRSALELDAEALDASVRAVNAGLRIDLPTGLGFCLYLRRDCLRAIGGFDEAFAAGYGEENDLCLRARAAGWRNVLAADVFVRHEGAVSFGARTASLQRRALAALVARHPDFPAEIEAFGRADPIRPARLRLDSARLARQQASRSAGAVLFVIHDWMGGVELHATALAGRLRDEGIAVYVLRVRAGEAGLQLRLEGAPGLAPLDDLATAEAMSLDSQVELVAALRALEIDLVQLHHVGMWAEDAPAWIEAFCRRLGTPLDVTIHDYVAICPRIHLEDASGRYCGEPDVAGCQQCLEADGSRFGVVDVERWRSDWGALLAFARRVHCATADVRDRLTRYFPTARYAVRRPPEPESSGASSPLSGSSDRETLQVLVPGAINRQKGLDVLIACAEDARSRRLPLGFRIVGYGSEPGRLLRAGVSMTGRHAPEEEIAALARATKEPTIAWLPSLAPETWSYALTSVFQTGLHPVVFDLGALAERVGEQGRGTVLPLALADRPGALNDALMEVARSLPTDPRLPEAGEDSTLRDGAQAGFVADYYGAAASAGSPDRVIFLDRDGVLNEDRPEFVRSLADWRPIPGSLPAVARLSREGFRVVVVTNQSGLARGLIEPAALEAIHQRLRWQVALLGGRIDAICVCPHGPDTGCGCRKPAPGLIEQAERSLGVRARGAFLVGDRGSDVEAARAAGCVPILVASGRSSVESIGVGFEGVPVHADLAAFVDAWRGPSPSSDRLDVQRFEGDSELPGVGGEADRGG